MIEVLEKTVRFFGTNSVRYGGMIGQLTKCHYNGVIFYVRENLKGINSFYISSGERWGDKQSLSTPRRERQSLDLLAPKKMWVEIAAQVNLEDTLSRKVMRSRTFNWKWAEEQFPKNQTRK